MKEPLGVLALVVFTLCAVPDRVTCHGGGLDDETEQSTDPSGCPDGWGCLTSKSCCVSSDCNVSIQWRAEEGAIRFRLQALTKGYIALGISTSGRMTDSEIYACSPNKIRRGWTTGHTLGHKELVKNSLSETFAKSADGYITCGFLRVDNIPGAGSEFLDLSKGNNYTVLAAWADKNDDGYPTYHESNKCFTDGEVDFTSGGIYSGGMDSEFLPKLHEGEVDFSSEGFYSGSMDSKFRPKLHGVLMALAWLGFAALGITTSRYYKPIWPETTLWGKPVWFTIHRTCMVSALICFLVAALIILIHVGGYILPSEGPVRFLHAVFGTTVVVLGVCNVIMALFRPHPGTPNRPIYNWAHWSVGSIAFYLALATILLGLADFEGVSPLLGGIPQAVFWVVVCFILFHFAIWMSLQYISVAVESSGRDNDVPLVNDDDELEKSPINGNVSPSTLDDYDDAFHIRLKDYTQFQQSTKQSARMKQLLFYVYISGIVIAVLVVIIGVIIAKEE